MSFSFFAITPLKKPRTECGCHPVVLISSLSVVPPGLFSSATILSVLVAPRPTAPFRTVLPDLRDAGFVVFLARHTAPVAPPKATTRKKPARSVYPRHQPDFILHTGDLTHLAKAAEFDTLEQILKGFRQKEVFYVPGEHDLTGDDGKEYLERFGKSTGGKAWQSFDHKGVHFIGLNNCAQLEGLGAIGAEQMEWLGKDVAHISASTPIVVFAHIPLWSVYPEWGWGTKDSAQALSILKRFGSVTVLNGHIHQVMQKVEGNVTFHSAMSTAFPQPAPGSAPSAGPMKVPADRLRQVLGVTSVNVAVGSHHLAIVDTPLG